MHKIILISFLIFSGLFAEDAINSDYIVKAMVKLVVKQENSEIFQSRILSEIKDLKQEIKKLKKLSHGKRKSENRVSKKGSSQKETKQYFMGTLIASANIRSKPSLDSRKIGGATLCSKVKIKKCFYSEGSIWCSMNDGKGFINRYLLSFDNVSYKYSLQDEIYKNAYQHNESLVREVNNMDNVSIDAISLNGKWSCLSNGMFLLNKKN